jgi:hypothetical protein
VDAVRHFLGFAEDSDARVLFVGAVIGRTLPRNHRGDADAAQGARQVMSMMGVSARAMNVDHSLEAARLRVALEPLGVHKADGVTTMPSSSGSKQLQRKLLSELALKMPAPVACQLLRP